MVGRVVVGAGVSSLPQAVLWNSTQLGSLGISHAVCLLWVGSAIWQSPERMGYLKWKGGFPEEVSCSLRIQFIGIEATEME